MSSRNPVLQITNRECIVPVFRKFRKNDNWQLKLNENNTDSNKPELIVWDCNVYQMQLGLIRQQTAQK